MNRASVRASLASEAAASLISDEEENNEILSVKSMPVTRVSSGDTSGQNVKSKATEIKFPFKRKVLPSLFRAK